MYVKREETEVKREVPSAKNTGNIYKRDLCMSKETYVCQKRRYRGKVRGALGEEHGQHLQKRPMCVKKDLQKRPMYVKRDLCTTKEKISRGSMRYPRQERQRWSLVVPTKETYVCPKRPTKKA